MADNVPGRAWRWWIPSLSQWLWLMVLLLALTAPWRTVMVSADGDACMHWRVGEYMLQTGKIIRSDVFSHTRFREPIISKEWLSEIIYAVAGRLGGLYGLSVLAALLIATTFALLLHRMLREGNDPLVAISVVLLAMWAATNHWLARPHVFSFLLAVLWNDALRRHDRDGRFAPLAVALCLLTLFWVNLHGAFLAGFCTLGAYWLGALIELVGDSSGPIAPRKKLVQLTTVGLLSVLVSLANPNGYHLHLHNIQFLRLDFFTDWLQEYRSISFQSPGSHGFTAWLALLFFTFAVARPRVSAASAILIIMWGYFALHSARNIALFAIFTAPVIASAISNRVRGRWLEISNRARGLETFARGWPLVAIVAACTILIPSRPTEMPADRWPVEAVKYIEQNPALFEGNMFNQYGWGGYLLHALPSHKVFVDGRADFYGEDLVKEFDAVTALRTNWMQILEKYDVRWSLMPTDHRLNVALALSADWKRVYSNEVETIFVKAQCPIRENN